MSFVIGTPHTRNAGYYRNDDRVAGGRLAEADVRTCTHCQAVIKMQDWKQDGAWCGKCNAPICTHCGARAEIYGCEPFMMQLERAMGLGHKYEQFRKLAGLDSPPPGFTPAIIVGGK